MAQPSAWSRTIPDMHDMPIAPFISSTDGSLRRTLPEQTRREDCPNDFAWKDISGCVHQKRIAKGKRFKSFSHNSGEVVLSLHQPRVSPNDQSKSIREPTGFLDVFLGVVPHLDNHEEWRQPVRGYSRDGKR